jgi:hypothetical protein
MLMLYSNFILFLLSLTFRKHCLSSLILAYTQTKNVLIFKVPLLVVNGNIEKVRLNNEKLLIKKLTESYPQKFGRPLINDSDGPVSIKLKMQLIQIVKLDATDQVFVTNVWNNYVRSLIILKLSFILYSVCF